MSNPHFEPPHSSTTLPETPSLTHSPSFDPLPLSSFAIKSTQVFLEESQEPCEAIILVQNGQIHDIIHPSEVAPEFLKDLYLQWKVEDYGDLVIFPGLVDSNVHLHANYDDDWENVAYCTNLAAAGGVTTIIDNPIMTSPYKNAEEYVKSLQEKIDKIQSMSKVDFGIYGLLEPKTKNHIAEILQTGALGLKCYLLRNFQNEINHIAPEMVQNLIKDLDKKHPETLVVFHPETATERELFPTSPCRTEPLEKRVDMDYDIKSISQTGAANKGSYLDENNDDDSGEEDDGLMSPDSPTKLKGRILKLKEKTDVKDIVHFELLSYSKDNIDSHQNSSSDSDKDLFEKLGQQSDGSRTQIGSESPDRNSESPEAYNTEEVGSNFGEATLLMVRNNSSMGGKSSPIKKSRFARLKGGEDSERGKSPESDGNMGTLFKKLLKLQTENQEDEEAKSQGESPNLQEVENIPMLRVTKSDRLEAPDILLIGEKTSQKLLPGPAHKLKNNKLCLDLPEEPSHKKPSPPPPLKKEEDSPPLVGLPPLELISPATSNRESLQYLEGGSQGSIGKILNEDAAVESEPAERPRMKAPRKASKFLTVIVNSSDIEKTQSNVASPEFKKTASSLLQLQQAPQSAGFKPLIQIGRPGHAAVRLNSSGNNSLLNPPSESFSRSPDSNRSPTAQNQAATPISNLLQRRALSRQSSCNTSTVSSPTAIRTMVRFGSEIKGFDSPPGKETKFNQNYKTFLANRPQNWEENAVSRVLNCFKKGNSLRIVFHNLSLASSFLKIRQKKKKSSHYKERIFADTAPGYLFFNEKAIKDGETKFKTSPPFRNKENQRLLVETLRLGGVDTISSYHFFVPPQYKQIDDGNFRRAFCGTESMGSSLQATYTALFTYQQKNNKKFREDLEFQKETTGKILQQAYKALCVTPAQMLKIGHRKGTIAKGKDADFVVWDPTKVDHNHSFKIYHLFNGKPLLGLVHKTFLRGHLIYDKDEPGKVAKGYNAEFIRP